MLQYCLCKRTIYRESSPAAHINLFLMLKNWIRETLKKLRNGFCEDKIKFHLCLKISEFLLKHFNYPKLCTTTGNCILKGRLKQLRCLFSPKEWYAWVYLVFYGKKMGTNCSPLLADLSLHAFETYFLQGLLKDKDRN